MKLLILLATVAMAGPGEHPPLPKASKEFDRVKALVGHWVGEGDMGGKTEKAEVVYKLTSGGSAVAETLGPGTPHEMISMYHDVGGKLRMTHYCAIGNQPTMELKRATAQEIELDFVKSVGINPKKDMHMRSVVLVMKGPDQLEQRWSNWANGKPGDTAVFRYKRKK